MSENRIAIYVPMPLNSSGDGPADLNETVRVEHQVWDAETNLTMFTAQDETTALAVVEAWNRRTPAPEGEVVGTAGAMPGTSGFTTAVFRANAVPVGTPLYASPVVPKTADEIKAVVMAWLDADDPASWGDFEKRLNAAVSDDASSVVPVGVSEAVLKAAQSIHNAAIIYEDEALLEDAEIVIAALRPTDTGRES